MFVALMWCLFFGVTICQGVQGDSSDAKQQEFYDSIGKAILEELGLKYPPEVTKEQRENVPQHMMDLYNKQVSESESKGMERTDNTILELENRGKKKINYCHRDRMFVDFRKIYGKKDYIIAPAGYSAYFCSGTCPSILGSYMNATNHAVVQSLVSLQNSAVPRPCCVPTELSKISVLYFDDNGKVQLKLMENMVAEACGCH